MILALIKLTKEYAFWRNQSKMTFTLLYVTAKDKMEARRISKHFLQQKLIACANMFPIKSMYWWKGKIVQGKEVVLILKTMKNKVAMVRKEIKKMLSYEIPCITEIEVKVNEKYGKWLEQQLY